MNTADAGLLRRLEHAPLWDPGGQQRTDRLPPAASIHSLVYKGTRPTETSARPSSQGTSGGRRAGATAFAPSLWDDALDSDWPRLDRALDGKKEGLKWKPLS